MPKEVDIEILDLKNLSEKEDNDIRTVLQSSRAATIFHTIEWNKILIDEFGLQNRTLLARASGAPVGLYSFYVHDDSPFLKYCKSSEDSLETVYGGPVANNREKVVIKALLRKAERIERRAMFNIWVPPNCSIDIFMESEYNCEIAYTSILGLERSDEEIWKGIHQKTKNMIRKALKKEIKVINGNEQFFDDYYSMFTEVYNRVGKLPLPKSFYSNILSQLIPKNFAKMLIALYEAKPVAGAIFLCFKDTVYYWHGASYYEYRNLAPNDLIQWEIIKWAKKNGYKYYDLVRIEPERLPGIARFKMRYGGHTVPFYHAIKETNIYQIMRIVRFIMSPRRIVAELKSFRGAHEHSPKRC